MNVFPLSHVDRVVMVLGMCENLVLGMCERLSAKSCRSCGQWSWVCVKIFPLSHVDRVVNGPGYV